MIGKQLLLQCHDGDASKAVRMSRLVQGFLGVAALLASLGVAQFAVGRDLTGSDAQIAATAQSNLVNRSAKADRPVGVAPVSGSTIVTQMGGLRDTSVVIRISHQQLQRDGKANVKASRRPVACEAPASVLTEIAQKLESGRCVT